MKFIVKIANNIAITYEMIALEGIFIERPSTKFTESQQDMIDYKTIYIHFHYSKRNNREVHANITMPIGEFLDGNRMMYIDAGKEQIYYKDIVANPAKAAAKINNLILLDTADAWTPRKLGFQLTSDVLPLTPAYVDSVLTNSPAAKAGLKPDDFIVMVNGNIVKDVKALKSALELIDVADPVELFILRNDEFQSIRISN